MPARRSLRWTAHLRTDNALSRGKSALPGIPSAAGAVAGANADAASAPETSSRAVPRMNAVNRGPMDARSAAPIATVLKERARDPTSPATQTPRAPLRACQPPARSIVQNL